MSGTFNAAVHDVGTFFNRIGPVGDIAIGLGTLGLGAVALPEIAAGLGGAFGAADVAGGAAAADVAGAALPAEAGLTAAEGGVGADIAATAGVTPELFAAGEAGPSLAGTISDFGALGAGAPDLSALGGAGAAAGPTVAGTAATAAGAAGTAGASVGDVLAGTTGPLAALDTSPVSADFAALSDAGIGPSVDISGDVAGTAGTTTAAETTAGAGTGGLTTVAETPAATAINPFAQEQLAGNLASSAAAESGLTPADVSTAAYGFPAGETAGTPAQAFAATTEPGAASLSPTATSALEATTVTPTTDFSTLGPGVGGVAGTPTDITPFATATGQAPAAATATPAAATGGGGITGALSGVLSSPWTKAAELAAPLGALGYTVLRGQPTLPPAMQTALNQLGPTEALANQELTAAANNQITPAQAQEIATYKQNAKNQLYQLYASSGRDPTQDTDYLQGLAQIDANGLAMQQQFIQSMITTGLQAQGAVSSDLAAAAQLQVQQDAAFQQSIASALQSFGLVAAITGSQKSA